jgi:hypothetical protein
MEITGPWDPNMDVLLNHLAKIGTELEKGIDKMPQGAVRDAAWALYSNLSAVSCTLYKICKDTSTRCSSQAAGSLFRTIIDSSISVFAFCRDPRNRAIMYLQFKFVLTFRYLDRAMKHIGCPLLPADRYDPEKVEIDQEVARRDLWLYCAHFLTNKHKPPAGKKPEDFLKEAVENGSVRAHWFRNRWFPEERLDVLKDEQMAWVYDVLYKGMCSCVHSDVWASMPWAGRKRPSPAMLALQFWGASVLRLSEALGVVLPPNDTKLLKDQFYKPLQWTPAK